MPRKRNPIIPPPQKFLDFLDAVNSLHGQRLPSYQTLVQRATETFDEPTWAFSQAIEGISLIVSQRPALRNYLEKYCDQDPDADRPTVVATAYETFWTDRDVLLKFLRGSLAHGDDLLRGETLGPVQVSIDKEGTLHSQAVGYEIFKGVDCRRLTICTVCKQNIYWMRRDKRKYCSKKCSNAFHAPKTEKEKEENNEFRRKARKVKKRKNNGDI